MRKPARIGHSNFGQPFQSKRHTDLKHPCYQSFGEMPVHPKGIPYLNALVEDGRKLDRELAVQLWEGQRVLET